MFTQIAYDRRELYSNPTLWTPAREKEENKHLKLFKH